MSNYPEDFLKAVNDLIDNWEGGYVDDPDDPGGETNMGISKRLYPDVDIKNLTRDEAVAIYYRDYWIKPGIDKIDHEECLPPTFSKLKEKVFNMGVLMGPATAKNLLVGCRDLNEYKQVCEKHFEAIVIRHPACARYLQGWTRRALA